MADKPKGDLILEESPDDLWAQAEAMADDPDVDETRREFGRLVKSMPQQLRDQLWAMYRVEYEPRDDGGKGYGVTDHLFMVYRDIKAGRDPVEVGAKAMRLSISYTHALRSALEKVMQ